jgi:hypothetical protein
MKKKAKKWNEEGKRGKYLRTNRFQVGKRQLFFVEKKDCCVA